MFHFRIYKNSMCRGLILKNGLFKRCCHNVGTLNSVEKMKNGEMGIDGLEPKSNTIEVCSKNLGIQEFGRVSREKRVSEIVQLIRSGGNDLESKLNMMDASFSVASVSNIFQVLNNEKWSAVHFFKRIRVLRPDICGNSDICSLVINNCGRLGDYKSMRSLLHDFKSKEILLNTKAFEFIPVYSAKNATMNSVRKVIEVLNEVGGSCRTSGIRALIKMFSTLGLYEMAKFVIEVTKRKVVYYKILIEQKCLRYDFKGARYLIDEMRRVGCVPDNSIYNYVLSSLCSNEKTEEAFQLLEEMIGNECTPNALTFEIFICHFIGLGKLESALEFLDSMVSRGLEPRLTTHGAFIKYYFNLLQYEEAYKYAVDSGVKYKSSLNMIYSLLASLHQKKGNIIVAQNILFEIMDKGLRPNLPVYKRVLKHLQKSGRNDLARDLNNRFCSLRVGSSLESEISSEIL